MSMQTKVTTVILNIKASLVFKTCWVLALRYSSLEIVVFAVTFVALAYEGNKLSPSNIEGIIRHKRLCLVLTTDIRRN